MGSSNRGRVVLLVVLVLVVLLVPTLGFGMMGGGMMGGGMMGPGMAGPGMMGGPGTAAAQPTAPSWTWGLAMGLGMLVTLAFWAAVIVGLVLLVRWLMSSTTGQAQTPHETPLDVLKRRYASGEITHAEYEQMRQALER